MSYELVNRSTGVRRKLSRQSWVKALELARLYGWQPIGTRPPSFFDAYELDAEWSGTYLTNDGQTVVVEDALSLAAGLERSLDDIPDTAPEIDGTSSFWLQEEQPEWLSPAEKGMIEEGLHDGLLDTIGTHPFEYFSGNEKQTLIGLIKFCRLGGFEIV